LGGAFGIALANNYIATHYAQHRADLMGNLYSTNPILTERLSGITSNFLSKTGNALTAAEQANQVLSLQVDKQAYLLSYLDTYRMISGFFICLLPLIFFLKKKKPSVVEAAEMTKAAREAH
jgi:MFS transporter, DHA2 family, multidrug resistance protein